MDQPERYGLPDPTQAPGIISEMSRAFSLSEESGQRYTQAFTDTFDWRIYQQGLALVRQVVHARGDNAHGAGYQFLRVAAFAAVFVHVIHLAVEAGVQPAIQARFIVSEADGRYAYLLKAEFPAPAADLFGKL